jgi:hypothetical protein
MIQLRIQYPDNIKYAQNQAEEDENGNNFLIYFSNFIFFFSE